MTVDRGAEGSQCRKRQRRSFDKRKLGGIRLSHPLRQQAAGAVSRIDYEMQKSSVVHCPHHNDAFPNPRMMRVMDQNVELLFLGSMSWDRAVPGNPG